MQGYSYLTQVWDNYHKPLLGQFYLAQKLLSYDNNIWVPLSNDAALYWRHALTTKTTDWINHDIFSNDQ